MGPAVNSGGRPTWDRLPDFKVRVTYSSADVSKPQTIRDGLPKDAEPYTTG